MTLIDELPDDVAVLKHLIIEERQQRDSEIERFKTEQQAAIDEAVKVAVDEAVKAAVAAILRRYYGPRCEKFDPRQLLLFGQRLENALLDEQSIADEAGEPLTTRRVKNRDQHGRQQLPKHLERIEIEHDLDDKSCPTCGNERCRIGRCDQRTVGVLPGEFQSFEAHSSQVRLPQVRPGWLRPKHRNCCKTAAADR